jgi:hypothetical protein
MHFLFSCEGPDRLISFHFKVLLSLSIVTRSCAIVVAVMIWIILSLGLMWKWKWDWVGAWWFWWCLLTHNSPCNEVQCWLNIYGWLLGSQRVILIHEMHTVLYFAHLRPISFISWIWSVPYRNTCRRMIQILVLTVFCTFMNWRIGHVVLGCVTFLHLTVWTSFVQACS